MSGYLSFGWCGGYKDFNIRHLLSVLVSLKEGEVFRSVENMGFVARQGVADHCLAVGEDHLWLQGNISLSLFLWKDIWLQGHLMEHRYAQRSLPDSSVFPLSVLAPGGLSQSGWI